MSEDIDFSKLVPVAKDSVIAIRAIKSGEQADGGGDLERNASFLEALLKKDGFKDVLSSDDELLLRSAIRDARN